ncbi:MAG: S-methyl-5-thioribose-1-phosphate isomerase [Hydrogenophilus sp.]|nr:S-methyl-5-thioribose-1-phosphate isomerase [Hydrogenophilus sp.]
MAIPPLPPYSTIRCIGKTVEILDQRYLPFELSFIRLTDLQQVADAITTMAVRGAPLIGVTAAFGVALAMEKDPSDQSLAQSLTLLARTRPTAVNLHTALHRIACHLQPLPPEERCHAAWSFAESLLLEDARATEAIGDFGLPWIAQCHALYPGRPVTILTHCNAGWVATCGIGTALAPIYRAHAQGIPLRVIASETRPRLQGLITAWELTVAGVPVELVADNATAWLLARGEIDLILVGADRIARNGDVANKIGTALKAYAARIHQVPFLVAAPTSTIDLTAADGSTIPIERRSPDELTYALGLSPPHSASHPQSVRLYPADLKAGVNPAFDITPAAYITAIITELGEIRGDALSDLAEWLSTHRSSSDR